MERITWHRIIAVGFTLVLIALITLAVAEVVDYLFIVMLAAIASGVAFFYFLFPGSRFFSIAFANFLGVYVCGFVIFKDANFAPVGGTVALVGFLLPIICFLAGAWLRRNAIRAIVTAHHLREERNFGRVFLWLLPVSVIGALTFLLPGRELSAVEYDVVFLVAMGLIAAIVFAVSHDVSMFLLDTGVLFEEFFHRTAQLAVPAFAFFTFYSLLVIVFATIYRIVDRYSDAAHFLIDGVARDITFSESLYFSLVTVSTVGYGDVVPHSDLVRIIVAVQILWGVVLLLFGFSEIIAYSRDRRTGHDR